MLIDGAFVEPSVGRYFFLVKITLLHLALEREGNYQAERVGQALLHDSFVTLDKLRNFC